MRRLTPVRAAAALLAALVVAAVVGKVNHPVSGQTARVDFVRDVQPILSERCISCHGPARQENGYRLDRRSGAFSGVVRPNISRGSSDSSPIYHRLAGTQRGQQMPPTGPLPADQIDLLKRWIDEGAAWPDEVANETAVPLPDPNATRLIEAIQRGDRAAARQLLATTPAVAGGRGPAGSTALMYSALYGDAQLARGLLAAGADPNGANHAGATALMWAVEHPDVVRALLDAGANPNASSGLGRTPLTLAAMQAGSAPVVRLLLDRGATPTQAALSAAALHGRVPVVIMLLAAGVRDNGDAAINALRLNCVECFERIAQSQPLPPLRRALGALLPPIGAGHPDALRKAIGHGADATVVDRGYTVLTRAASVGGMSPGMIRSLIDAGAAVEGTAIDGLSALDVANRSGNAAVAEVLVKAGAKSAAASSNPVLLTVSNNTVDAAVRRSLPLLQRTAVQFYRKSGCVSCHHNSVTQMTVAAARAQRFPVDESAARQEVATLVKDIRDMHDQTVQGIAVPGGWTTTTGYILIGLAAERHPRDAATDALVRLIRVSQRADGRWYSVYRPPIEASDITATAVSVRGLTLYGATEPASADAMAVRAAAAWLKDVGPKDTEDRVFRLFGLTWAGAESSTQQAAVRDLVATQRADGGWAQLPSLASDAYATGEALVALAEAGMRSDDVIYRRGVEFLLRTQLTDGSWFVHTRSLPTQVYFESGFPHGAHQFVSAAASNWATLALIRSLMPRP